MALVHSAEAPVAAIIVSYNSAEELPALLRSLAASTIDVHVIVVDNGSTDASVEVARTFEHVTVVPTGANLGYSGGINAGRERVRDGQAVAILNPDLVVAPDALERMLDETRQSEVGVVGPMVRNLDGSRFDSVRHEPSLCGAIGEALFGARWRARPSLLAEVEYRHGSYLEAHDADWLSGAALLVRADCARAVGDWDAESFFLYSEETDFARRARAAGYRVRYTPHAVVTHVGGASGQSSALTALLEVNRLRYVQKHRGAAYARAYRVVLALGCALRAFRSSHRHALATLLSRARWSTLPAASAATATTATTAT